MFNTLRTQQAMPVPVPEPGKGRRDRVRPLSARRERLLHMGDRSAGLRAGDGRHVNRDPRRTDPLLDVGGLTISFAQERTRTVVVRGLDLRVAEGETVALVGESGSGKSVSALAITRLIDYAGGRIDAGSIRFRTRDGVVQDLAQASPDMMRTLRGPEIAMVFQEPMTSLNPVLRIGDQIAEAVLLHQRVGRAAAREEARRMLERVRIPEAARQLDRYPFQLSGGMRQRVMIAMALSCRPRLLIADEPTTALDVTVQAQVLRLMRNLQAELGMGLLFITHDMGVVAEIADRVVVMRAGEKVEEGDAVSLFDAPREPYTRGAAGRGAGARQPGGPAVATSFRRRQR